jgi:hypothetical protein
VFWRPEACASVLSATAVPIPADQVDEAVDLTTPFAARLVLAISADGLQHVRFADEHGRALQLAVIGADLLAAPRLLRYEVVGRRRLGPRALALAQLDGLLRLRRMPKTLFPREPRGRRLRDILRALDGDLAGAPRQEIATALFGTAIVDVRWRDPRQHLQDQVRRAVHRGRNLMAGNYRMFLN